MRITDVEGIPVSIHLKEKLGYSRGWIDTREASELTGYSVSLIAILARKGKVGALKVGRDWLVNRDDVLAYQAEMNRLGNAKHDPRRSNL